MAQQAERDMSVENLRGRHVIDRSGTTLGAIDDLAIDSSNWRVTGLVVTVDREVADRMHLKRPFMGEARVQVGTERIEALGENVLLNVGVNDLAALLQQHEQPAPP